ncbi:MAG: DUF1553 domain-containing protein [Thermoguttaceae bacterium]
MRSVVFWLIPAVAGLGLLIAGDQLPAFQEAKPASAEAEPGLEAKATSEYEAAEKAAREAEAALGPLREAMQKADAAFANASREATAKRQQATDAKNLAGEMGAAELKRAEAELSAAVKALADATKAKPALDKALADARAAARPLQEAYEAAEKAARQAEAAAKAASDAANKLDDEAKRATVQAALLRRAAAGAKAALVQAQQAEQEAQAKADAAAKALAIAEAQKKTADEALASAKGQVATATTASEAAEKAAQEAAAKAKQLAEDASKPDPEKKQAAEQAAAKRKAADEAKAALVQAQQAEQEAQAKADAAAQNLAQAATQKKAAEGALAAAKNQVAAATAAFQAADQAAQAAAQSAEQKQQAAAQAAAKRKAVADAAAALGQAQQAEQQAQAKADAAAKALAISEAQKKTADEALAKANEQLAAAANASEAAEKAAQEAAAKAKEVSADATSPDAKKKEAAKQAASRRKAAEQAKAALAKAQQAQKQAEARAAAAAQKLAEAQTQNKAAQTVLADAKSRVGAATAASQAAQEGAKEFVQLDLASKQAAAEAAARRKAAEQARAALAPAQQKLEQAALQANAGAQELARAEARKKSAEQALASLQKRIAAAKQTHAADEKAAEEAEAVAALLKVEAEKTRAAYLAGLKVAEQKRDQAERAKAVLYRLVAARQLPSLMDSPHPPKPANRIDEIVLAKLKSLGIEPVLCSDAVFIRRAYLDLTGKLPSAEEARAFIQDPNPNKRAALIDRLLDQPAHTDYWAMKWSDVLRIKAEFPVKVWPNAAQAYYRWVWESLARNKRYDQFARELLTSSGSNFRVGPVNFYRAIQNRTPEGIAAAVGLTLMGTRVQFWPEERRAGMAVFFSQVGYKPTSEWKEEIVFWDPLKSAAVPGSTAPGVDAVASSVAVTNQIPEALAEPVSENGPMEGMFPDGTKTTIPPDRDPREVFADWLIRAENPWFAKAIANRTWAWAMGRGIIHEPDDIREDNPPSNPELLAYLEKELVSSGYDLRHLKRLIFTTAVYQFSSVPRFKGPEAKANFASYPLRRLEAEVLIDALNRITGGSDLYTSPVPEPFTYIPKDMPAVALADGSVTSSFLTLFGRSARATGMESERVSELDSPQWLYTLNSAAIQSKLQNGPKLAAMLSSGGKPSEIAERLYLTILSRFPTEADLKAVEEYSKAGAARGRDMWIDLVWALLNSPEFLLRH